MRGLAIPLHGFWRAHSFPYREVFIHEDVALERGRMLVTFTYAVWIVYSVSMLKAVANWPAAPPDLLWHVAWARHVPWEAAVYGLIAAATLGALFAGVFPGVFLFRLFAFVAIFELQGIRNSFGKINHSSHAWVLALLLLVFLPRLGKAPDARRRRGYLEIIWGVQAMVLACYSVAGIQKLLGAWEDWGAGGATVFNLHALAYQLAAREIAGTENGPLAGVVLAYPAAGAPLFLGAMALEVLALGVALRPRWHAPWAAMLAGMHLGISATMNIAFDPMILMVGVWFFRSPFAHGGGGLGAWLRDFPWLGAALAALYARWRGLGRTIVFYDGECAMCNTFVRLLLRAGVPDGVYFASQQGRAWAELLAEKPWLNGVDSVVVLTARGEEKELRIRSEGVLWTLAQLRAPWCLAWAVMLLPVPLLDIGYRVVARFRRRLSRAFPGAAACPVPAAGDRGRFID